MDNTKSKRAININELCKIDFLEPQLKVIKSHRRKIIIERYIYLIGAIFILLFLPYTIVSDNLGLIKIIFISGVEIIMIVVTFQCIKIILSIHCNLYQKAQYGIIEKKFTETYKGANSRIKTYYYLNIIFPEKNGSIENVSCRGNLYLKLSEGDKVLVVSFYKNNLRVISIV